MTLSKHDYKYNSLKLCPTHFPPPCAPLNYGLVLNLVTVTPTDTLGAHLKGKHHPETEIIIL